MTEAEAHKCVAYLVAAFPHAKIADETVEIYVAELQDLRYDHAREACRQIARDGSIFFPALKQIRDETRNVAIRTPKPLALEDQRPVRGDPAVKAKLNQLVADLSRRRSMETAREARRTSRTSSGGGDEAA